MNIPDTTQVLARIAAVDQRTVGEADILAWSEILPDNIEVQDAVAGITLWFRRVADRRIMPANVISCAREAYRRRHGLPDFEGD